MSDVENITYEAAMPDSSYGPVKCDGVTIGFIALVYKSGFWHPLLSDTWLAVSSVTPLVVDQPSLVQWASILSAKESGNIVVRHCGSEKEAVRMVVQMDRDKERWVAEAMQNISAKEDFSDEIGNI